MLRTRRKVNGRKNVDNESLKAAMLLKTQRIEACKKKLKEYQNQIKIAKQRIEKLNTLLQKYDHLHQDAAIFFENYTALLNKTVNDLNNLRCLQIGREKELFNKVNEFEKALIQNKTVTHRYIERQEVENISVRVGSIGALLNNLHRSLETNLQAVVSAQTNIEVSEQEETLAELIKINNKKYSDLQLRLEGEQIINPQQVESGTLLVKIFSDFRRDVKELKEKLIEYAGLVDEERQRLCLVKCLRTEREVGMLEEQQMLKEQIKHNEQIQRELKELLTKLKFEKLDDDSLLQKLSLLQ